MHLGVTVSLVFTALTVKPMKMIVSPTPVSMEAVL